VAVSTIRFAVPVVQPADAASTTSIGVAGLDSPAEHGPGHVRLGAVQRHGAEDGDALGAELVLGRRDERLGPGQRAVQHDLGEPRRGVRRGGRSDLEHAPDQDVIGLEHDVAVGDRVPRQPAHHHQLLEDKARRAVEHQVHPAGDLERVGGGLGAVGRPGHLADLCLPREPRGIGRAAAAAAAPERRAKLRVRIGADVLLHKPRAGRARERGQHAPGDVGPVHAVDRAARLGRIDAAARPPHLGAEGPLGRALTHDLAALVGLDGELVGVVAAAVHPGVGVDRDPPLAVGVGGDVRVVLLEDLQIIVVVVKLPATSTTVMPGDHVDHPRLHFPLTSSGNS
jgi:hypothetical protein